MTLQLSRIGPPVSPIRLLGMLLVPFVIGQSVNGQRATRAKLKDNQELAQMHHEDQADRTPSDAKSIDWNVVGPRDKARLARVKELYARDQLRTAHDYYRAAMILQHGEAADDYLLAHEFCVAAIIKGKNDRDTRWLAAASEDRFLMNIERPQRFGTQYGAVPITAPWKLYKTDPSVTDELRRVLSVPTLAKAKAREAEMNKEK